MTDIALAAVAFVGLLAYLTMVTATAQTANRYFKANYISQNKSYAIQWTLALQIFAAWFAAFAYFAETTTGWGQSPSKIEGIVGQGWSEGMLVTVCLIPLCVAAFALIGAPTDHLDLLYIPVAVLWPLVLLDLALIRVGRLVYAGPSRLGTKIADIPQERALRAAQSDRQLGTKS